MSWTLWPHRPCTTRFSRRFPWQSEEAARVRLHLLRSPQGGSSELPLTGSRILPSRLCCRLRARVESAVFTVSGSTARRLASVKLMRPKMRTSSIRLNLVLVTAAVVVDSLRSGRKLSNFSPCGDRPRMRMMRLLHRQRSVRSQQAKSTLSLRRSLQLTLRCLVFRVTLHGQIGWCSLCYRCHRRRCALA